MVTSADIGDRAAGKVLLAQAAGAHHRLELVWADGGYTGSLIEHCLAAFALVLAIVKRSDDTRGFVVLPKRWIVERLFAHLMRSRPWCARLRTIHHQRRGDGLLVGDHGHDPPPGPVAFYASVKRPGCRSASQPRATSRFDFDLSASTFDGTASRPNKTAISWQVSGP